VYLCPTNTKASYLKGSTRAFLNGFGMDLFWNKISYITLKQGYKITLGALDKGFFEYYGPFGIEKFSRLIQYLHGKTFSGYLYDSLKISIFIIIPLTILFLKHC
jgi:hypothetical protein